MLAVQNKTFKKFDYTLGSVSLLLVAVFIWLSATQLLSGNLGISLYTAVLSTLHLLYLIGFYPSLKNRSQIGASLLGSSLLIANVGILVVGTGSFNSPYYALWLILVLALGIYRPAVTLGFLGLTTLFFGGLIYTGSISSLQTTSAVIAMIATYISGGLGFWLWHSRHTQLQRSDDISQLSTELSQAQLKAEILIQHIGEGVLVADAKGRVQLLNPAAEALTGWREVEAKGIDSRLVLQLLNEDEQALPAAEQPLNVVIAQAKSVEREDLVLATRSGKRLAVRLMASPISGPTNQVLGTIVVFRDVTQAKAAERQRNEFISTASHEMRTPVAAVEGYIALALNPKVAKVDAKAQLYLTKAQTSIQHLGNLFQDLLSTTRIEEGKLPNHPEVVEVAKLVVQITDELKFKAKAKNLELAFTAEGVNKGVKAVQPLYYVQVDPERIREVITNLIDNAIKFTPSGSVTVTLDGDDNKVVIGVKDSGIGIAPEDMPHLFQKFYRIDNTHTRNIGGTGLGLYICRAIVELYQGRIWVESKPGEGSHFKFSLPRLAFEKAEQLLNQQDASQAAARKKQSEAGKLRAEELAAARLLATEQVTTSGPGLPRAGRSR